MCTQLIVVADRLKSASHRWTSHNTNTKINNNGITNTGTIIHKHAHREHKIKRERSSERQVKFKRAARYTTLRHCNPIISLKCIHHIIDNPTLSSVNVNRKSQAFERIFRKNMCYTRSVRFVSRVDMCRPPHNELTDRTRSLIATVQYSIYNNNKFR